MARNSNIIIAGLIALIVLGALMYLVYLLSIGDYNSYTDKDTNKNYIGNSAEECLRIQVTCVEGYKRFDDDKGCGCEKVSDGDSNKNYCTSESREAEACITLYDPVCGWKDNEKIKTYGNSCIACMDENVEYWTSGEC